MIFAFLIALFCIAILFAILCDSKDFKCYDTNKITKHLFAILGYGSAILFLIFVFLYGLKLMYG